MHATSEEDICYRALKQARPEHVTEEVLEAYEEHKQIKTLLGEIAGTRNERFDAKLKVLKEDVEHHVEEEEGQMFPDAKKCLGDMMRSWSSALGPRAVVRCQPFNISNN